MLTAITSYSMFIFLYSKQFCTKLISLLFQFWWDGDQNSPKIRWVSWQPSCSLKFNDGLGFKDFEHFNLVVLAKQCWRLIHNPSNLWARVLKDFYFPRVSFWEVQSK